MEHVVYFQSLSQHVCYHLCKDVAEDIEKTNYSVGLDDRVVELDRLPLHDFLGPLPCLEVVTLPYSLLYEGGNPSGVPALWLAKVT